MSYKEAARLFVAVVSEGFLEFEGEGFLDEGPSTERCLRMAAPTLCMGNAI